MTASHRKRNVGNTSKYTWIMMGCYNPNVISLNQLLQMNGVMLTNTSKTKDPHNQKVFADMFTEPPDPLAVTFGLRCFLAFPEGYFPVASKPVCTLGWLTVSPPFSSPCSLSACRPTDAWGARVLTKAVTLRGRGGERAALLWTLLPLAPGTTPPKRLSGMADSPSSWSRHGGPWLTQEVCASTKSRTEKLPTSPSHPWHFIFERKDRYLKIYTPSTFRFYPLGSLIPEMAGMQVDTEDHGDGGKADGRNWPPGGFILESGTSWELCSAEASSPPAPFLPPSPLAVLVLWPLCISNTQQGHIRAFGNSSSHHLPSPHALLLARG